MNNEYYLDTYFEKCGLDVTFNTLGRTEELARAYVSDTRSLVESTHNKSSEYAKPVCYNKFYIIENRTKLTGFEKFNDVARAFKSRRSEERINTQFMDTLKIEKNETSHIGYKQALKNDLKTIVKPILLYLSGGMDSELVAMALLDAGVKFTPVIFSWTDSKGEIQNSSDTDYAFKFCRTHSLLPVVRTVDIEKLWQSDEFRQLSLDARLISAHLTTHVYMIKMIDTDYPNVSHLFGGEVRYASNYLNEEDNTFSDLVTLSKVMPGYNGLNYGNHTLVRTDTHHLYLKLILNPDGTWQVITAGYGTIIGSPVSGTFSNAPLSPLGYQARVSAESSITQSGNGARISPVIVPSSYATILAGGLNLITVDSGNLAGTDCQYNASYTVQIQSLTGGGVQTSGVTFNCFAFRACFPAGAMVMLVDGSSVAIETVKQGDMVMGPLGPVQITKLTTPLLGSTKMLQFADGHTWSENHAHWTKPITGSTDQWWWSANADLWRSEIGDDSFGGLFDNSSMREGDGYQFAHLSGWKTNAITQVDASPDTVLYFLQTDGSPIIVNGYVVGAGVNQAGFDYTTLNWDTALIDLQNRLK